MKIKKFNIIGIGELLWDMLPDGKELGGAPANFAYHANFFGANSTIISALGNDQNGNEIELLLKENKLKYSINKVHNPTGRVSVKLDNGIPNYVIHENVAWDFIALKDEVIPVLEKADAICFGTLSQRSKVSFHTIHEAIKLVPKTALKVLDINLRESYYTKDLIEASLKCANVVKLNDEELMVLSEMFHLPSNVNEACKQLLEQYSLKLLAFTKGAEGSILYAKNETSNYPTPKVKVLDTIGAGDSFTAAMVMGLLKGKPLKEIHKEASEHAAKVCTYKGATPRFT
ncbi:MAG: carbohydrate kinase [Lutibacter sp.]|nr:carbohydrate kinase [Lutibacter sp.]